MSKRKHLTLEDRVKVLEQVDKNLSQKAIAAMFDCGRTQIQNIIKDKVSFIYVLF